MPGRMELSRRTAIDDAPNSLEPLLDLVRRDQADGLLDAPWPPVYPKMDGEPPRVAPSRAKKSSAATHSTGPKKRVKSAVEEAG